MKNTAKQSAARQASKPVLDFDKVSEAAKGDETFSLAVGPGELVAFEISSGDPLPDVAGLATGLVTPAKGEVSFLDQPWSQRSDDDVLQQRLMIGQVFNSPQIASWIENLDIDENIYLAQQMAAHHSQAKLVERATRLAHDFGLDELPSGRRSKVKRRDLMRSQWVRAFLPDPLKLLILERPTIGMPQDSVKLLLRQVAKARKSATAVLWLDAPLSDADNDSLSPTLRISKTPLALLPTVG